MKHARPQRNTRSFGKKPGSLGHRPRPTRAEPSDFRDRPTDKDADFDAKKRDDRKPGDRKPSDRPWKKRNDQWDKRRHDRPKRERTEGEASGEPKKTFEKPFYAKKPDFRKKRDDKPWEKPRFERSEHKERFDRRDKPKFDKPRFDKPGFNRPKRDRQPEKTFTEKPSSNPNAVLIWGLHAVRAAWMNPARRCSRLWLTEGGNKVFESAVTEARDALLKRPDAKQVERHELDRLVPPGSVHQGILLETLPLPEPPLHELVAGDTPPDILIMLDQITDPHNVGAIMRSAAALGAGAVIMTERNAPGTTGVLAKAASGAIEHVPQIHVVNLARALDELQEAGYWRVGLAEEGGKDLCDLDLSGRTVLVLGAEGDGLRQLTRKKCDELARLPTTGPIGSLNVSNAAAVALYEVRRQKKRIT